MEYLQMEIIRLTLMGMLVDGNQVVVRTQVQVLILLILKVINVIDHEDADTVIQLQASDKSYATEFGAVLIILK